MTRSQIAVTPGTGADIDFDVTSDSKRVQGVVVRRGSDPKVSEDVATAANQTTLIGHVDGIEGLLGTIDADTGAMVTALQTLDNIVSGNEAQVDVVAALPAGSNVIGKVDHPTNGYGDGRKVVASAGTAERLVASTTAAKWVIVTAEEDNTGVVVVGASTVVAALGTRRGYPIRAFQSVVLPCKDVYDVWINATVAGEGVTFLYGTGS